MYLSGDGNLRIHELNISNTSEIAGKTIMESGLKNKFNLLMLGTKDPDGHILFNPPPGKPLNQRTTLIVMGDVANIKKAQKIL
ncbi:MAG: TrkA C-terminal domain-containing protein [Dissulfuribacterales bacterium]